MNMIDKISNSNNLIKAFVKAKQGCDWKNSVQEYEINLLKNIRKTQLELKNGTYQQGGFYEFYLCERGKDRFIRSISIYDRVVQRVLCDEILNPIVYPYLIYDNGASVKNKGIDFARNRIENHLHKYYRKFGNKGYVLMIDFSKFFDNIPHQPLIEMYDKIIDDKNIINLISHLVNTFSIDVSNYSFDEKTPFDSLKYSQMNINKTGEKFLHRSLGIGSQISQISGIFYPSIIDNYCKIVCGYKYYGRYMDDIYIISNDKEKLKNTLIEINKICDKIGLFINCKKTHIFRIDKGFTFLKIKYRLTNTGHLVRIPSKKNIIREKRKLKKLKKKMLEGKITYKDIENQYKAWKGNLRKYDCHRTLINMDNLFNELYSDYKKEED